MDKPNMVHPHNRELFDHKKEKKYWYIPVHECTLKILY